MATRLCGACQQEKSIRGVWYLTPAAPVDGSFFLCESCFRGAGQAPAQALGGPMGAPAFPSFSSRFG